MRSVLATIRTLPERLVKLTGHSAQRAEPNATDADIDATADAVGRVLSTLPEAQVWSADALVNAAGDALRMSTDRGRPEREEDLASLAKAIGLDRAHLDTIEGVGPWLETNPATAFSEALVRLYGPGATDVLSEATDEELLRARRTANRIVKVFATSPRSALRSLLGPQASTSCLSSRDSPSSRHQSSMSPSSSRQARKSSRMFRLGSRRGLSYVRDEISGIRTLLGGHGIQSQLHRGLHVGRRCAQGKREMRGK